MKKACSVCLINCLRLHGGEAEDEDANACLHCSLRKPIEVANTRGRHRRKGVGNVANKEVGNVVENVQAGRHPSFLKKITESTMSTLKLPLSFVADHIERLGEWVMLEGPGKEQWRVELHRCCGSVNTNFGQGWEQFVVDHVLQIGDQLSFSLAENSYFRVEVYDGFGVQKRSALDATNASRDQENIKDIEVKDLHNSVDVASVAKQEGHDKPEKATQSAEPVLFELIPSSESESRIASAPGNAIEIAEALGLEAVEPEDSGRPAMELADINNSKIEKGVQLLPAHTMVGGKVASQRRPVTELQKVGALQGAHALNLVNPNTFIVMAKGHVYKGFWLPMPRHFARDWLPSENKEITLLNKSGHKWPVKWLVNQGGLSAGWRRFSLDHRLEEHDVCVFELIDKAEHTLLVHIFRVLGGPAEDPGLYTLTLTPTRTCEGKRTARKSCGALWNGHVGHCTPGQGQESVNNLKDQRTCEPRSETENRKRKLLEGDEILCGSLAQVKRSGNGQDHQNVEKSVDHASVDERGGNGLGNMVALNGALEPGALCGTEIEIGPTDVTPQIFKPGCTDLVELARSLLTRQGLVQCKDRVVAQAASADEVHEQISNFADVPIPADDRRTPTNEACEGRREDMGQRYKVVHIYSGRNVGNKTEFLTELEGYADGSSMTTLDRDDDTGFWWVPSDQFEWDMRHCAGLGATR